ncbi:MAG TPA: hypothetical protein DCL44_09655 [Elusimicrobia bacterium]|nr:hypothetical protein [Elusimicrobiota bacterium]
MSRKSKRNKFQDAVPLPVSLLAAPFWLVAGITAVWFYIAGNSYLSRHPFIFPFRNMPDIFSVTAGFASILSANLVNILWFAAIIVISYRAGEKILGWFKVKIDGLEYVIFSIGLGFGLLAYLMLGLGFLGFLYKLPVRAAVAAVALLSLWKIKLPSFRQDLPGKLSPVWWLLIITAGLLAVLNAVMAFMPEVFYDALVYHLSCPNYYLLNHKISPMRFLSHSNFPADLQMLYMLALALKNEILAKMIHFSCGFFTLLLMYLSVKRHYDAKTGILSALIFYSIPMVAMNSWTCGNDVGVSFFFALSFFSFLKWLKEKEEGAFLLSAVFMGIAWGSKYTAVFMVAGAGAAIAVYLFRHETPVNAFKKISIWGLIIFMLMAPWFAKNYAFTRNPIQPFLPKIMGGENLGKVAAVKDVAGINPGIGVHFNLNLKDLLLSPWTMTINGNANQTYLGPVFLLLLPLIFFLRKPGPEIIYSMLCFSVIYVLWYLGTPVYRYILGAFVCLAVPLARAWTVFAQRAPILHFFILAFFLMNFGVAFEIADSARLYGYVTGKETKDEFLSRSEPTYPNPPYSAIQWANRNLPPDAMVLFVGESKSYYLQRKYISYSVEINAQPIMEFLKNSQNPADFRRILSDNRITHLLINYREALRVNPSYNTFYWTERERKIFDEFWKNYVKLEYFEQGAYVYSVLAQKSANTALNVLEELEKKNWQAGSLLPIFIDNRMWRSAIDEYKLYRDFGNDVHEEIARLEEIIKIENRGAESAP